MAVQILIRLNTFEYVFVFVISCLLVVILGGSPIRFADNSTEKSCWLIVGQLYLYYFIFPSSHLFFFREHTQNANMGVRKRN